MSGLSYPYIASPERADHIMTNFQAVQKGHSEEAVLKLLLTPDEVHELYEPLKKNPKAIGKTYWYIIKRMQAEGSQTDKDESVVRVSFDLIGRVISVDHWGIMADSMSVNRPR